MFSVVVAVVFAGSAGFAVWTIARAFAGGAERIDALFDRYNAMEMDRAVRAEMKPVTRFTAAPAPRFGSRNVVAMPRRATVAFQFRAGEWRAAA